MPEHPTHVKQQSVVSCTLMGLFRFWTQHLLYLEILPFIHWAALKARSPELCSVRERARQRDQAVVKWPSHWSRVTKEARRVPEASVAGEDSVQSLWKAPVEESQCRPLGFWRKSLSSAADDDRRQKAVPRALRGPGEHSASDREIPRGLVSRLSIVSWV